MDEYFTDELVYFLESSDFDDSLKLKYDTEGKNMLIMVGGSFCGYCRMFAPEFNKLATSIKDETIPAVIQVDGNQKEKELGKMINKKLTIQGVPSFILYTNSGDMILYNGPRDIQNLAKFCKSA